MKERIIPLKDINVDVLARECLRGYVREDIVRTIDLMEIFVKMGAMETGYIQFDFGKAYVSIRLKEGEE